MSPIHSKQLVFERFAQVAKALGHRHRMELLDLLAQGPRNVDSIAKAIHLPLVSVSQHLQVLKRVGLLRSSRAGQQIIYALSGDDVLVLMHQLWKVAEQDDAVTGGLIATLYRGRDPVPPVTQAQLPPGIQRGRFTLVDVRPDEEYRHAHIPAAISIPLPQLATKISVVPKHRTIVTCCRGPFCVYSYEAVEILRRRRFDARRLDGGFLEWKLAKLPLESSGDTADKERYPAETRVPTQLLE